MPKLVMAMRTQSVELSNRDTKYITSVLLWEELVSLEHICLLLEGEFFPKWFNILSRTLQSIDKIVLDDIANWYLLWRNVIPEKVVQHPLVTHYFSEGLNMISAALIYFKTVSGNDDVADMKKRSRYIIPHSLTNGFDYFKLVDRRKAHEIARHKLETLNKTRAKYSYNGGFVSSSTSFKDVIEDFALQYDMTFVPKRSSNGAPMTQDGKAVWVFDDKVSCYIDQTVLFARIDKVDSKGQSAANWEPVDLDTLLRLATS